MTSVGDFCQEKLKNFFLFCEQTVGSSLEIGFSIDSLTPSLAVYIVFEEIYALREFVDARDEASLLQLAPDEFQKQAREIARDGTKEQREKFWRYMDMFIDIGSERNF